AEQTLLRHEEVRGKSVGKSLPGILAARAAQYRCYLAVKQRMCEFVCQGKRLPARCRVGIDKDTEPKPWVIAESPGDAARHIERVESDAIHQNPLLIEERLEIGDRVKPETVVLAGIDGQRRCALHVGNWPGALPCLDRRLSRSRQHIATFIEQVGPVVEEGDPLTQSDLGLRRKVAQVAEQESRLRSGGLFMSRIQQIGDRRAVDLRQSGQMAQSRCALIVLPIGDQRVGDTQRAGCFLLGETCPLAGGTQSCAQPRCSLHRPSPPSRCACYNDLPQGQRNCNRTLVLWGYC